MPPPSGLRPSRPPGALALAAGLLVGAAGGAWILAVFERNPIRGLHYHVPLAVAFGAFAVQIAFEVLRARWGRNAAAAAIALVFAGLRLFALSPFSGHAVLGVVIAFGGAWPLLRIAGGLIVAQAFITKLLLGEAPLDALYGALAGLVLAALLHVRPASSTGSDDGQGSRSSGTSRMGNASPPR